MVKKLWQEVKDWCRLLVSEVRNDEKDIRWSDTQIDNLHAVFESRFDWLVKTYADAT